MKKNIRLSRTLKSAVLFSALLSANSFAEARKNDTSPITIVVPFAAGTATDVAARYIGKKITDSTNRTVIIDNKPGANGIIGIQTAKSAPAGTNVILMTSNTTQAANPGLFKDLPYDPVADFKPITMITIGGVLLVVKAESDIKNVNDLIKAAKKNPGKMTFGGGNSTSQAGGALLKQIAGIDMLYVPYKSTPASMVDLIGGQIDIAFGDPLAVQSLVQGGKVRAIGVTAAKRIPGFEDVPTLLEQGLANYELSGWIAAYAPRDTPDEKVQEYNKLIVDILNQQESVGFFGSRGWLVGANSSSELAAFQKSETTKWKSLIDISGMKAN